MIAPNLPLLPDPDLFTEASLDDPRPSSLYCRETLEQHALAAYHAGRNSGLEEAAGICDARQPWGNSADDRAASRLRETAQAIRSLKSDSEGGG